MNKNKIPSELAAFVPIIDSLSAMLGEKYFEFVLHDFRYPESSLCYIKGCVTGRNVGAPLTDRLLKTYKKEGDQAQDVINIITNTEKGKRIKTSSIFIRNNKGKIVGSFGINIDVTAVEEAMDFLSIIGNKSSDSTQDIGFAKDVNEILDEMLNETITNFGKPPEYLAKEERIDLIKDLEQKGIFLIKGAIEETAKRINVSRYTIYNYLEEIRKPTVKEGDAVNTHEDNISGDKLLNGG